MRASDTRALRKYLGVIKKNLQNVVDIELGKEHGDLGFQPAALFDFGNLQNELPYPALCL